MLQLLLVNLLAVKYFAADQTFFGIDILGDIQVRLLY